MQLSLLHFEEAFEWLNTNIAYVRDFLKYADEQNISESDMDAILGIAYEADDIVCEVEYMSSNMNHSCVRMYKGLLFRSQMLRRIKKIQDSLRSIIEEVRLLKLYYEEAVLSGIATRRDNQITLRRTSVFHENSKAVGIQHKVEELFRLLDNRAVPVLAVVGMGGLGKTFLVQHFFNLVKTRFEYSIWVTVSQSYSLHNLRCEIASQIMGDLKDAVKDVNDERAAKLIYHRLHMTRCLIVLDDVWRADEDMFARLGLPTGHNNQCIVVVTTRSREVCQSLNSHVYEMEHLSEEASWSLFCVHAFPDSEGNRSPVHLKSIALRVLSECGRLPLALKTVGASLSNTTDLSQWESTLRRLQQADTANNPVMQVLKCSYDSLSQIPKLCFTFLSFFAKSKEIDGEDLISLWIGEGLIPEGEAQRDNGRNCLHILANSSLLEVNVSSYLRTYCQMKSLLLDLAIYVAKKSRCVFSLEGSTERGRNCRRILLESNNIDDRAIANSSVGNAGSVSTLSLCDNPISTIPEHLFASMKVLRILDLSRTRISTLPESIANLKLLRVLNLCRTNIQRVPDCVRYLASLRFLNISQCESVRRLPEWIAELKYLEHLNVAGCSDELASYMPDGISKLLSLQILTSDYLNFSIQENKLLKLEHVAGLTRLEELCINVNHIEELKAIEEGVLEQLVKMRSLAIANEIPPMEFENVADLPPLPDSMKTMEIIEKLYLWNFAVPEWVCDFKKLRVIEIYGDCGGYPQLEKMPFLERLCLLHNHICTALPQRFGKCSGFPKLRFLEISAFPLLEKIPHLEDGAMQCLEKIWIYSCERVKNVPDGLERLRYLKRIEVDAGSQEVWETLMEDGENWNRIKAINPHVEIVLCLT